MSGHTQGPWEVDRFLFGQEHIDAGGAPIWGPDGMPVCRMTDRGGETRANAALTASAPDLLAALREARIALTFYRQDMERHAAPGRRDYPFGIDAEEAARAAIARAEGKVRP